MLLFSIQLPLFRATPFLLPILVSIYDVNDIESECSCFFLIKLNLKKFSDIGSSSKFIWKTKSLTKISNSNMFRRLEVGQLVKYWFPLSFIFAPSWQSVPPKINERVERDFSNIFAFKLSNPFRNLFTGPESDSCLASCQSVRHWVRALFETWLMWPWRVKIHAILPYLTSCNVQEMLNMQNMQNMLNLQTKPTKPNM